MVSVVNCGSSGPGSSPALGLYCSSASLLAKVLMCSGEFLRHIQTECWAVTVRWTTSNIPFRAGGAIDSKSLNTTETGILTQRTVNQ